MAAFFGSDEFLNGLVWGSLITVLLILPIEVFKDWRRR